MIVVTGTAGLIGANFLLDWLAQSDELVINLDKLTYASNRANLATLDGDARHVFVHGDMGDRALVAQLLAQHRPRAVFNFAAESHVDHSIHGRADFNVYAAWALATQPLPRPTATSPTAHIRPERVSKQCEVVVTPNKTTNN